MFTARRGYILGVGILAASYPGAGLAAPTTQPTTASSNEVILLDSFGRAVVIPREDIPRSLQPRVGVGLQNQLPKLLSLNASQNR